MKIGILGPVPSEFTFTELVNFICNRTGRIDFDSNTRWHELLSHYRKAGERYGVRWDIAFFQSCLETGFFSFQGDVRQAQNNFAGLGATGGGVPGESYRTPENGILAQIQVLAIRAGVRIPRDEMLSKRYQDYYDVVFNKAPTWDLLAGTWAADPQYWSKIQAIARQFRTVSSIDCLVDTSGSGELPQEDSDITWWEFNRTDDGKPCVTGYNGSRPVTNLWGGKTADLVRALADSGASTYLVADTRAKIIPDVADWPEVEPPENLPEPDSPNARLNGIKILLDPGHSTKRPGAQGLAPDFVKEHDVNLLQAEILRDRLSAAGAIVTLYDPPEDNLTEIGSRAAGQDMFISLHHNAFDRDLEDEYTCVMVHKDLVNAASARFASVVAQAIAATIGHRVFQQSGQLPGVYPAGLSVLRAAHNARCPVCVLTESYFLDAYGSAAVCRDRSARAAEAIFEAILEWYK